MKEKRLLTIPQAAREIGMSRVVLWRHVKKGNVPTIGTEKIRLIDADDLERFRTTKRQTGRPPRPPAPAAR